MCHLFSAHDVGLGIDLDACARLLGAASSRQRLDTRYPGPPLATVYRTPPLRVTRGAPPMQIAGHTTEPEVELLIHDFGVVSLSYRLPLAGSLDTLVELSCELYDNAALLAAARRVVDDLLRDIAPAVRRPERFEQVEDYVVYELAGLDAAQPPAALLAEHAGLVARILRSERAQLSPDEVADAHAFRLAYGNQDLALIDWNAALLLDRDAYDVRAVLEFANLELLELRYLDRQLDHTLAAAHAALRRRRLRWRWPGSSYRDLRQVAELQVESAVLFEEVTNSLKLLGDQYLARVYRLASQRFHLEDWDAGIRRKLETVESVYQKLSDRAATRRLELLEWIIIVLIALSIALPFVISG